MNDVFLAIRNGFTTLLRADLWRRILLPWIGFFILILVIFVMKWPDWFLVFYQGFEGSKFIQILASPFSSFWSEAPLYLARILAGLSLLTIFLVSIYLISIFIFSVLLIPLLIPLIVKTDYPQLQKKKSGSTLKSLSHTLISFVKYTLGFLLTLPFWLVPGMSFFLTVFWNGYLAGKVFPYDVLMDWASEEELQTILNQTAKMQLMTGTLTSMLFLVPGINFIAPILMALTFVHYNLNELQKLRKFT